MYSLRDVRSYPGEMIFTAATELNSGCGCIRTLFSLISTSLKLMGYLTDSWYRERVEVFHVTNVNWYTHSPYVGMVCSLPG